MVHNGIIENYIELKHLLQNNLNIKLKSETDTEVIAHLIDHLWNGNLLSTLYKVVQKLTGSYAISVIAKDDPDKIIAVRKDSPLIIGIGENENFIASDIPAIFKIHKKSIINRK
ncbi:Glutamine-fructose-6-phosphate transaminase [Candidatus Arthromitus sp. SFB-5]|nr:Glutamine-fructose-6-phosphate transaminase [Candidatus Arthromitus sp. SFB-5]